MDVQPTNPLQKCNIIITPLPILFNKYIELNELFYYKS